MQLFDIHSDRSQLKTDNKVIGIMQLNKMHTKYVNEITRWRYI